MPTLKYDEQLRLEVCMHGYSNFLNEKKAHTLILMSDILRVPIENINPFSFINFCADRTP